MSLTFRILENLPWLSPQCPCHSLKRLWLACLEYMSNLGEFTLFRRMSYSGHLGHLLITEPGDWPFHQSHAELGRGSSPKKEINCYPSGKNNRCLLHVFWISHVTQALPKRTFECFKTFLCDRHFVFVIKKTLMLCGLTIWWMVFLPFCEFQI